jgi:hypothetical protein
MELIIYRNKKQKERKKEKKETHKKNQVQEPQIVQSINKSSGVIP